MSVRREAQIERRKPRTLPLMDCYRTLSPYKISPEDEVRLSVKKGLEVHFFKALSNFSGDGLAEVINKKYSYNEDDELTLLIETVLFGHINIIKHLLGVYNANINAVGKVKHFGSVIDGASALWCAAGYGHFEILKLLIANGAIVDHCTKTKSTPLRAACYLGRADIVKYLIENGANVNLTNIFNSSCLMIACYKGHLDVVEQLLQCGANVNLQTNCGASAMHFAAQSDHVDIVRLLLSYNALQLRNNLGLTPVLVAAERTHFGLMYFLMDAIEMSRKDKIEAEELLGASYLNDKESYNYKIGYSILLRAMELRYHLPIIPRTIYEPIEAYGNRVECQTIQELRNIKDNHEALHYESLIIREKILGCRNTDLLPSIIYRGAVYADAQDFEPCLKLWYHAMKIAQNNQASIYKDILRFTQVFCQMIKANVKVSLFDLKNLLEVAVEELTANQRRLGTVNSSYEKRRIENEYSGNVLSTLGLIMITSITLELDSSLYHDPSIRDVMNAVIQINRLGLKGNNGQTLLHLCINFNTNVDKMFTTGICCFPNYPAMKLLIYCGADVNAFDSDRNTPLHLVGKFIQAFPHIPHDSDHFDTKKMVIELLNAGAHSDFVNIYGQCPYTQYLQDLFGSIMKTPRSLKCLSATMLKKTFPPEYYHEQMPTTLEKFTEHHGY